MANHQLTICQVDTPLVADDKSPDSFRSTPSPATPLHLQLPLLPSSLTTSHLHPSFSLKRCKEVLRFARKVLNGFKSKNYTHNQQALDLYLCSDRECSCIGHYGQMCTNDDCSCTRHIITLMCGWYPDQCPSERLGNYRGCKASGSLVNTNLHVCHRMCPFTVSNRKTGRACSLSGCFYEEMELYAADYTFKIDTDLIDRAEEDGPMNLNDDDDFDDPMIGHDRVGSGAAIKPANAAGTVNQLEPAGKSQPSSSAQTNSSSKKSPKAISKPSSRNRVFARTAWDAVNKDLSGVMDCLRWNIISTAKTAIRLVMHSPRSISEEDLALLATVAASYYVDYRVGQDHTRVQQARSSLFSPGPATSSSPCHGNGKEDTVSTALYSTSKTEQANAVSATHNNSSNPSNLSNLSNPSSNTVSSYRKASVSVKRRGATRHGMSSSSGSMETGPSTCTSSASFAAEDNGMGIEFAVASDRSTKQSNLKMFRYFVLAVVQGCLSNDDSFPRFDFMTLDSFMDMKQWSRVIGISNRRVTKYCTSISQSVEEGVIKIWQVGQSTGLRLPPEVLQWDDWITPDD